MNLISSCESVSIRIILAIAMLIFVAPLRAELRVLDQQGLVRAIAADQRNYHVVLKLDPAPNAIGAAWLVHEDGIAPDQHGITQTDQVVFKDLPSGNWRIKTAVPSTKVLDVEIK